MPPIAKSQRTSKRMAARPKRPHSRPVRKAARTKTKAFDWRPLARYDAAETNNENRRWWVNADALSARQANSPEVRKRLRERARYEAANNSYCKGMVLTLANDLIGTGPRLQMLFEDRKANRQIERAFGDWAAAIQLPEKLHCLKQAKTVDGEAFGRLFTNQALGNPVQLDLQLIEADQIMTPDLFLNLSDAADGIEFDRFGKPLAYHVLPEHPSDTFVMLKPERVPARLIIHWFRLDRPGQVRGVPEITASLPLFAQLRRYTLAVIAAAETAADFACFIKSNLPPNGDDNDVDDEETGAKAWDLMEIQRRMLMLLPEGHEVSQIHAEQPATTYEMFKREILNEIARVSNMPFNIFAGNSSSYNYASGRLDHAGYFKSLRVELAHLRAKALDRLLSAWADEAVMVKGLLPAGVTPENLPHRWFFDGYEHVDPVKEANADQIRLESHTDTLARIYAERGEDWEEALEQRAREVARSRQLGLPESQGAGVRSQGSGVSDPGSGEPPEENPANQRAGKEAAYA